ncbi:hypothetical protein SCUCBS95973_001161 [Sporothrix curviconia]|uniref:C6 zinc finger domain containing protein n=1 Tax=Sporothrix curviconia TaxID=1260050 RepID=A0ABP0AWP8_9PEZI
MDGKFMFVDGIQNDRPTKRLMRRHVMQGKNAGKIVYRPSRLAQGKIVKAAGARCPSDFPSVSPSLPALAVATAKLSLTKRFGSVMATVPAPVAMTPVAWQTISDYFNGTVERVYAAGFGISSDSAKPFWFQAIFTDEAAYHCTIALMQASNESVLGSATGCVAPRHSAMYAHYVAESLASLKQRLAGPQALANSTIFLVLLFISQEQMRHESRNARVHVAGLEKMVALRGGLSHFETRPIDRPLLLKICKIDIVYALQFGFPPRFHRDVLQHVFANLGGGAAACRQRANVTCKMHHGALARRQPRLYETLRDVLTVALLFENTLPARPIDIFTFGDIFSSLCYRLMKMQNDLAREGHKEDIYHLGLMMFSMTLFLRFDQGRLLQYQPVGQRFREYVEGGVLVEPPQKKCEGDEKHEYHKGTTQSERSGDTKGTGDDETCFWVMMMGGAWTLGNKKTRPGLQTMGDSLGWQQSVRRVRQVADRLGLASWEDACAVLSRYPWLTALHDRPGRELWELSRDVHV